MNFFGKIAAIFGPRLLGAVAGAAAAKIAESTGVVVDPATLIGLGMAAYAGVHKIVSSKVNPGDAASGRVAQAEKVARDNSSVVKVESK